MVACSPVKNPPASSTPAFRARQEPEGGKPAPPWQEGALPVDWFRPARVLPMRPVHFSACLYHEPEFAARFPSRSFAGRYLSRLAEIDAMLAERGHSLSIFCDAASLQDALSVSRASVYLVTLPPRFPFQQHVWRYFSALLPRQRSQAHVFRGMDNLLLADRELTLVRRMVEDGAHLMHAPYVRARGSVYTPVRGSCVMAGDGLDALAWFLTRHEQPVPPPWPDGWFSDEVHLARFYQLCAPHLHRHTLVDRVLPFEFHADLDAAIRSGLPLTLIRP